MTTTDSPIRIRRADPDLPRADVLMLGGARPDYVCARPVVPSRYDHFDRWIVETVWTDGSTSFSAEFTSLDRADMWAIRLADCWTDAIPQFRCYVLFGTFYAITADRYAELNRTLTASDPADYPDLVRERFELARYLGRFLAAF